MDSLGRLETWHRANARHQHSPHSCAMGIVPTKQNRRVLFQTSQSGMESLGDRAGSGESLGGNQATCETETPLWICYRTAEVQSPWIALKD